MIGLSVLLESGECQEYPKTTDQSERGKTDKTSFVNLYVAALRVSMAIFVVSVVAYTVTLISTALQERIEVIPTYVEMDSRKVDEIVSVAGKTKELVRRSSEALLDGLTVADRRLRRLVTTTKPSGGALNQEASSKNQLL
jgi:hypothetical protein